MILVIVLLVPGRVGGYFLRDLFRGRRLCEKRQFRESLIASDQFLRKLEQQPWRRYFIVSFFGIYTWDVRAMALNNMGTARLELGELDEAELHFRSSLQADPGYPLPYHGLGVILIVRNDQDGGRKMLEEAAKRGFSADGLDQVIARITAVHARYQSALNPP